VCSRRVGARPCRRSLPTPQPPYELFPAGVTLWATLGVSLKSSKITFGIVSNLIILVLALVAAVRWAQSRRTARGRAQRAMEER
jgi:branched-subunit amino acid ABC-type transport system permease component